MRVPVRECVFACAVPPQFFLTVCVCVCVCVMHPSYFILWLIFVRTRQGQLRVWDSVTRECVASEPPPATAYTLLQLT